MNKKTSLIVIALIVVMVVIFASIFFYKNNSYPSDSEIRKKFKCDRMTKEYLSTDIYCDNPELYRQDLKASREDKNGYKDCVKDSITKEQAQIRNYAGNIRDDTVTPKICGNSSGTKTYLELSS